MGSSQICSIQKIALAGALLASAGRHHPAHAQAPNEENPDLESLKRQVEALTKQVAAMAAQDRDAADRKAAPAPAPPPPADHKPPAGPVATVLDAVKSLQFYGNIDLAVDDSTKGIAGKIANDGMSTPAGHVGWMPAISTNISYVGVRGKHSIGFGLTALFQLETQLDIAATAGTVNTNSNNDDVVKGALTSRNSFVGVSGAFGAIKIGKTDAPLKNATARLNPFAGSPGDYAAIVGNTGGDNRTEFGGRLDHALWYESPKLYGLSVVALWAPGQNRSDDNSIQASGEAGCTGGNVPGSGALPYSCNDGSFGAAFGASASYETGPIYVTAAYELHKDVNRTSDADGTVVTVAGHDYAFDSTVGIADESAWRFGAQLKLPTQTTVGGLYEDLRRDMPYHYFDERSRKAFWLQLSQQLTRTDLVNLGYAHAYKSPGSLGEHNIETTPGADNSSNMFTGMYRDVVDDQISFYIVYAMQANQPAAHYDLGAGGRSITTDCHDGSQIGAVNQSDGTYAGGGPFCYTGGTLQAVSVGMTYKF